MNPNNVIIYGGLVQSYLALNRWDEAKTILNEALAHKIDPAELAAGFYALSFLKHDAEGMQKQFALAMGKPGDEDLLLGMQARTDACDGRLAKAQENSRRAVESAQHNGTNEVAAIWQVDSALRQAEFGNSSLARQTAAAVLPRTRGRYVEALAALALARGGDVAQAQALADHLVKDFPADTQLKGYWLLTIRAAVEISREQAAEVLESRQSAQPYELGEPVPFSPSGTLYPVYMRGYAYLDLRRGTEAAAEFQKISNIAGSSRIRPWLRWLILPSLAPERWLAMPPPPAPPIRISSPCGKTPTLTSQS